MALTPSLILTPLRQEFELLVQTLRQQGYNAEDVAIGKITGARLPALATIVAVGGHGKAQCGIQTRYLLDRCGEVRRVICAGAAGSLVQGLHIGDLVIGTHTVEHDYTLRFSQRPLPRFAGDAVELARVQQNVAHAVWDFSVHWGAIASGDEDIISAERATAVATQTGALCVAWEGAGVARACAFNAVPFMEIRAITDAADTAAPMDFSRHLALALRHLVCLLSTWLGGATQ